MIEVWYGPRQVFGARGSPQRWVNVLGRIHAPEGIAAAGYRLNGGAPSRLRLGPDGRRLLGPGDFNVEVDPADLRPGSNVVRVDALSRAGLRASADVEVVYDPGRRGSLPATVDWAPGGSPNDVAQVVDGRWRCEADGVRTVDVGYDRLIAVGDVTWQDYELTVPMTVHGFDTSCHGRMPSMHSAAGVVLRWQGHYEWDRSRPRWGYAPVGAVAWYSWIPGSDDWRLTFLGGAGPRVRFFGTDRASRWIEPGRPHQLKAQVRSRPGRTSVYRLKVWPADEAEPEPWDLASAGLPGELDRGAACLVAHHADVTFGRVDLKAVVGVPTRAGL
jgi:hypothetical protein